MNNGSKHYILVTKSKPLTKTIPSRHKRSSPLLHNDGNRQREMRYAPNQESVFVDEQNEFSIVESIVFLDGSLMVDANNQILQEFMDRHPFNIANGGAIFKVYDADIEDSKTLDKQRHILKVSNMVASAPTEALKAIIVQLTKSDLSRMTDAGIINAALGQAKINTSKVESILKNFKGPVMSEPKDVASDVADFAIAKGLVSLRADNTQLFYNALDKKTKISDIPAESSPTETLVEFFKSAKGHDFYVFVQKERDKE